jgi:hypothetical protein
MPLQRFHTYEPPPPGYCCYDAYGTLDALKKSVYCSVWTLGKRKQLRQAHALLDELIKHEYEHTENAFGMELHTLEQQIHGLELELRKAGRWSTVKRIGIGLLLGFLSVSTIRYWLNVLQPQVREYGLRTVIHQQFTPSKPQYAPQNAPLQNTPLRNTPAPNATQASPPQTKTPPVRPLDELLKEPR